MGVEVKVGGAPETAPEKKDAILALCDVDIVRNPPSVIRDAEVHPILPREIEADFVFEDHERACQPVQRKGLGQITVATAPRAHEL